MRTETSESEQLVLAAEATYSAYIRSFTAGQSLGSEDIPRECWAKEIVALHPVRVYSHRVNLVVVQKASGGVEEGQYIYIPISSYLPRNGEDGFTYQPNPMKDGVYQLGTGVFNYTRSGK